MENKNIAEEYFNNKVIDENGEEGEEGEGVILDLENTPEELIKGEE